MMKFFLLSLFSLFSLIFSFGQEKKLVTISGTAPTYVGQTISFFEIEDYFSMKENRIASTNVQADSTFNVSFYVNETKKIIVRGNKNHSFLYIQPNAKYDIYLPEKDKFEPYRPSGNSVEITFFNLDSTDINYSILQFQRWSDDFIGNYFYLRKSKPMEFAQKMEEFKTLVEKKYNLNDTTIKYPKGSPENYMNVFVRYSFASMDNIQYAAERNRYEKHDFYIKHSPVEYQNDEYMAYINAFYEKMTPRLSMETNNRVYLGLLKSSPTMIMRALGAEYTLINMRLREMIMIKMLSEEFYSKDFPQTNILTVLDSVSNHGLFDANAVIAKNMKLRLTELTVGGKAPDFVLKNEKGETKLLTNYGKKHLYIHFYDPSSSKSTIELEPLKKLYETYKEDIQFVTVYPDKEYKSEEVKLYLESIPWEKCKTDISSPVWNNYKIETFPNYVLIDGYGYVVGAPALGPMPNGQYETIDKSFFYIQKVNAELRGGN